MPELTFEKWMSKVDAAISQICGLTSEDLADQCYRDWYEDEMSPSEAASEALEAEGFEE